MKMVKKRVAELEGAQLDCAVGVAEGYREILSHIEGRNVLMTEWSVMRQGAKHLPRYSEDWFCAGPIIERERIELQLHACSDGWWAGIRKPLSQNKSGGTIATGPTPLIAAMRALVASKLGDEVEVPA